MKLHRLMALGVILILVLSLVGCTLPATTNTTSSLRDFESELELTEWREEVGLVGSNRSWESWRNACLELQDIGLKDGYNISLCADYIYDTCRVALTVTAGSSIYLLYPDELDVYLFGSVY